MTYTTVYKKYPGGTIAEAAAAMLADPDVWNVQQAGRQVRGDNKGYSVDRWEWHALGEGGELTVWFR